MPNHSGLRTATRPQPQMTVALASAVRVGITPALAHPVARAKGSVSAARVSRCRSVVPKSAFRPFPGLVERVSVSHAAPRAPRGRVIASAEGDGASSSGDALDVDALVKEVTDFSKIGQRDEAYFVGQMVLLFCIAFPPAGGDLTKADLGLQPSLTDPVIGVSLLLLCGVMIKQGVADLGNSLTPFPKPRDDAALVTAGAYQCTRHPMYSGLVFGACGAALVTGSPVRTLLAAALAALLYFKSGKEEAYLEQKHGEAYAEYKAKVPRLVPNVAGIGALLEAAFGGEASAES